MIIPDYQTPARMALKQRAIPLPELAGRRVLDIGCDMGFWSFLVAGLGAASVLGIDRNRFVRGVGPVDLIDHNTRRAAHEGLAHCRFRRLELGCQWHQLGTFDVVLMLSVYHHVYQAAGGDHLPIWFWLSRHIAPGGVLIWEGPVDDTDPVVFADVAPAYRAMYNRAAILAAAAEHFSAEPIGPALHEPTREVWRFTRRPVAPRAAAVGIAEAGAGGATKAFEFAGGRRMGEIEQALGVRPLPGSLNVRAEMASFDWSRNYFRVEVLDVVERGRALDAVDWRPRWARFRPVRLNGLDAFAFRFEGEAYPDNFLELIADTMLRDAIVGRSVVLQWRC